MARPARTRPSGIHLRRNSSWEADEDKFDHPTQKPIELIRRPILNHLRRGELVYDPFLGSGTTLAAAELNERACYGIELDPKYVDVVVQRWQQLTGKQATLDADGLCFDEIAMERRKESALSTNGVMIHKRETPPGWSPAARCERQRCGLGFHGVIALPVLSLCGRDRQPHLLPHRAGKESTQGMRLPVGRFQQFLRTGSARPLQQVEDQGGFAALTCVVLCALGRFLLRVAFFPDLPLAGATLARRAPAAAFFVAFGSVVAAGAGVCAAFLASHTVLIYAICRSPGGDFSSYLCSER
jgi:DNA methylase